MSSSAGWFNSLPVTNAGANIGNNQFNATPWVLGGLAGAAGAIPTPSSTSGSSASTSNTNTSGRQDFQNTLDQLNKLIGSQSSTASGGYATPGATSLSNQLVNQFSSLANQPTNLKPYEDQQINQINRNSQSTDQSQQEALAARGLATSPIAASVAAGNQANRVGQITNFQQGLPLLQQQLLSQNLNSAGGFLNTQPKSQTTTGTQEQSQTGTQTGTGTGTSTGSQDQNTNQNSNQKTATGGGAGGFLGGLTSILASLFI